jgi:uncharacterized protein YegP (UPF0339 family)
MIETFEIGHTNERQWHFQLKAPDGEVLIQSEDYDSEDDCLEIISAIKRYAENARILSLAKDELH